VEGAMYLGIDLGTSELKLLLLGKDQRVLDTVGEPLAVSRPQPQWSEQEPAHWWQALERAVQSMRQRQAAAWPQIKGIGLSGQMHGAVVLDAAQRVLRPAILWNDGRSAAQCEELLRRVPDLHQRSGNLAMPGFTAPKLLWLRAHEPALFTQIAQVLLPKDYLRLLLTGESVSDPSDASGTLWMNPATRDWDDTLLAATGLSRSHMPRLVEGSAVSGQLRPTLAEAWGLKAPVWVAGGAGDNAASAVGIGAVAPGQGFISLGTSGVMFVVTDQFMPNPAQAVHAFCHTLPQRWHQMTVMLSAASALSWLTRLVRAESEAALMAGLESGTSFDMARAPIFLPYLSGERTPHNDVQARGMFFGLDAAHGALELTHAVLEGVAFGMAQGLQALRLAGSQVPRLGLVGGGARSPYWAQLHADVLGVEVQTLDGGAAGGALGAARLAALACGANEADVCRPPAILQRYHPRAALAPVLQERLGLYTALYPRLRDLRLPSA
jgi:xylulokinase